jgi:hypothetical protein
MSLALVVVCPSIGKSLWQIGLVALRNRTCFLIVTSVQSVKLLCISLLIVFRDALATYWKVLIAEVIEMLIPMIS